MLKKKIANKIMKVEETRNDVAFELFYQTYDEVLEAFKKGRISNYEFTKFIDEVAVEYSRGGERYYETDEFDDTDLYEIL